MTHVVVIKTSKEQKYTIKFNLINYFLTSVFIARAVFTDQYFLR